MNFLAHAFLSGPAPASPGLLVGNMTADFIKGRARHELPTEICAGFLLHRRIDAFTDTHPLVARCSEWLEDRWGRYSTVLTDIFLDHVLAANWAAYSPVPLRTFVQGVYATLQEHKAVLPERARLAVTFMMLDDWLTSYAEVGGIALALARLSRRLRHGIDLAPAVEDLRTHRAGFQTAFDRFFPELIAHARIPAV